MHSSSKAVGKEEGEDAVVADEREVVTVEEDPDHGSHIWIWRRRRRRGRRRHMLDRRPIADRNAPRLSSIAQYAVSSIADNKRS